MERTKSMKLTCDGPNSCGEVFECSRFRKKRLPNKIDKVFIKCTHCGKEFVSYYTDPDIRKKQKKISKQFSSKLREEIAEDMDKLRKEIEG